MFSLLSHRTGEGMNSSNREASHTFLSKVDQSGRIVLPAELRNELGIAPGDTVNLVKDETGLHVQTPQQALKALQEYFRKIVPPGVNLADELIAERRAEAERE